MPNCSVTHLSVLRDLQALENRLNLSVLPRNSGAAIMMRTATSRVEERMTTSSMNSGLRELGRVMGKHEEDWDHIMWTDNEQIFGLMWRPEIAYIDIILPIPGHWATNLMTAQRMILSDSGYNPDEWHIDEGQHYDIPPHRDEMAENILSYVMRIALQ